MSDGSRGSEQNAGAAYDALNASYRLMDEYMRQSQRVAEQLWMPWIRPFMGTASPFFPPEQWVRASGDLTRAWMSMAQAWTTGLGQWTGSQGGPAWPPRTPESAGPAKGRRPTR